MAVPAEAEDGVEALLAALPGHVAVVALSGEVLAVNGNWMHAAPADIAAPRAEVGRDYFAACAAARGEHALHARAIAAGLHRVLAGVCSTVSLDHARHGATGERWFRTQASRLRWQGAPAALLTHTEITPAPHFEHGMLQVVDAQADAAAARDTIVAREMGDALARSRAMLETSHALAQLAGVEIDHATGRVDSTSGIVAILGLKERPRTIADLTEALSPASATALQRRLREAAGAPFEMELEVRDAARPRWVRVLRAAAGASGAADVSTLVFQDITAIHEAREEILRLNANLERRVQRRTRQLEAANRELEAFSYSVSHDLKAPLAAIDGFVHVLSERLQDRLDEREARYLDRVRAGVGNMFALIDAMLALHQLSRGTRLQRRWVDVAALAESVVAELREADPGRVAWIRIERPLQAYGDAALLGIVLRNLVGNAWKFSAQRPQVEIEIAEQADGPGGFTTLRISDRGAGFDPAMAHKLFAPFQRLHPSSEFPGTGVGLATVHRIVQRHAGMIRADSAPGAGATFWVSLPLPSGDADTVSGE